MSINNSNNCSTNYSISTTPTTVSTAATPITTTTYQDSYQNTINKKPNLAFKLFSAENGYILEVMDKIPDIISIYQGVKFGESKVYVLDSSESLGERISQILALYTLQK